MRVCASETRSGNAAVDVADPADGQKLGWMMNLDRMGSPGERVCKAPTSRAHVLAWGTPRNARLACDAQGDVMAARVVGIRQEGESLPDGAVQEGRGARTAAMTSRKRCAGCELPRWCAGCELPCW